jgi:hypothetical protein
MANTMLNIIGISKILGFTCALFLSLCSHAELIFSEDFESDGLNQRYTSAQQGTFDGPRTARDWHWQRQSSNQTGSTDFYTNFKGQDFWSGINLDENGSTSSAPSVLLLEPISTNGITSLKLSVDLAASSGLETSDFLSIYSIDMERHRKTLIDTFQAGTSIVNEYDLTNTFQTFEYILPDLSFNFFQLSFEAFSNASKESFAIDNIQLASARIQRQDDQAGTGATEVTNVNAPDHLIILVLFILGLLFRRAF